MILNQSNKNEMPSHPPHCVFNDYKILDYQTAKKQKASECITESKLCFSPLILFRIRKKTDKFIQVKKEGKKESKNLKTD